MADMISLYTFCKSFVACTAILLTIGDLRSNGYTINDTDTLYNNLLQGYNKYIRGTNNQSDALYLSVSFNLVSINDFDELTGKFSVVGFFYMIWTDDRMTWDPKQYNGVPHIEFPIINVWKPIIVIGNPQDGIQPVGVQYDDLLIGYSSSGNAFWQPGDLFEFVCFPDVKYYPFDTQTCQMQFLPWGYIDDALRFHILKGTIDMSFFEENGSWLTTGSRLWADKVQGNYEILFVEIDLKRRSFFYLINMILPIGGMGLLNIFVFLLPPESGERVGYSITVLLAIAVFQTIASDNLPKSSYPSVAALCFKLLADFAISCFVMIFTIISLRIYNTDTSVPVPRWLHKVTMCFHCCFCCHGCCKSKSQQNEIDKKKMRIYKESQAEFNWTQVENEKIVSMGKETDYNHEDDITWTLVGKLADCVFALFSLLAFLASNVVFIVYISNGTS